LKSNPNISLDYSNKKDKEIIESVIYLHCLKKTSNEFYGKIKEKIQEIKSLKPNPVKKNSSTNQNAVVEDNNTMDKYDFLLEAMLLMSEDNETKFISIKKKEDIIGQLPNSDEIDRILESINISISQQESDNLLLNLNSDAVMPK